MEPISPDVRTYVQDKAPGFVHAVATLKEFLELSRRQPPRRRPDRTQPTVHSDLTEFAGDMALLYACLWYARTEGVSVTFQAEGGK